MTNNKTHNNSWLQEYYMEETKRDDITMTIIYIIYLLYIYIFIIYNIYLYKIIIICWKIYLNIIIKVKILNSINTLNIFQKDWYRFPVLGIVSMQEMMVVLSQIKLRTSGEKCLLS